MGAPARLMSGPGVCLLPQRAQKEPGVLGHALSCSKLFLSSCVALSDVCYDRRSFYAVRRDLAAVPGW
jgi:hypothetical protein